MRCYRLLEVVKVLSSVIDKSLLEIRVLRLKIFNPEKKKKNYMRASASPTFQAMENWLISSDMLYKSYSYQPLTNIKVDSNFNFHQYTFLKVGMFNSSWISNFQNK